MAAASTWANCHRTERSDAYGIRFVPSPGLSCTCREEAAIIQSLLHAAAAEECHISPSAISQQIQASERELGSPLLQRVNRKFTLTAAGDHFYRKSVVLVSDLDRLCLESAKITHARDL